MRPIKFRAWYDDMMYYNHSVTLQIDGTIVYLSHLGDWLQDEEGLIKLMQFTGLKDKKGTDIYEGDIICLEDKYKYEVRFEDAKFVCYHTIERYGKWGNLHRLSDPDFVEYHHEVIGNIYANSELLNQQP